tara:strand:+ start:275 stop:496 length:222 start_codon:yes stop_codon:yes gene_type:complete
MTEKYCSLSIRVDADGSTYVVDDRGLRVKGVRGLKLDMHCEEITEATLLFRPSPKKKEGDKSIGIGVGRMRIL